MPERASTALRHRMKAAASLLFALALLLGACAKAPAATPSRALVVFAAASLAEAFDQIGPAFEAANPGVTLKFNFSGSQTLRAQIEQGAQADVFASANAREMETLAAGGFIAEDGAHIFLTNQMVVIMPAGNPNGLARLADLGAPGMKIVLASPDVPAGDYSLQLLDRLEVVLGAGYKAGVLANVVSYENDVKQVVAKVRLGEADAGIVYRSDAVAAPGLETLTIPPETNIIARYQLAALAQSKNPDLARAFVNYLFSPAGQAALSQAGFLSPK